MRVLLFSSLYPSAVRPLHGIFVETRLRELLKSGAVQAQVVAPVPWFPSSAARFGAYARFAATAHYEQRHGIDVYHPRYLLAPKIGMSMAPYAMALGALALLRRLQRDGFDFDLIDAHYYYPDGVAAALLARWLDKPLAITARGSDINLIANYRTPRWLMRRAATQAGASIGVSQALTEGLAQLGAPRSRLHTLRNGVDLQRFAPQERALARVRLGLAPADPYWLAVGHLTQNKGQHLAIEALAAVPGVTLLLVGSGPEEAALRATAERLGVAARVHWAGAVAQQELMWWYSAADALVLCSRTEGWANVLLEAMACGTPVLATAIEGTTEVVRSPAAGRLLERRDAQALVAAWGELQAQPPTRAATRAYAEQFAWDATTQGQLQVFRQLLGVCSEAGVGTEANGSGGGSVWRH